MSKLLCSKTSVETRQPKQTKGSTQTSLRSTRKGVIMMVEKATLGASHSLLNVASSHSSCLIYRYEEWITLHGTSTHSCLIRLVEWSTGLLAGRSVGRFAGWLVRRFAGWLVVSFIRSLNGARISFCHDGNRADLGNVRINSELTRLGVRQD